ncbi:MAG: glutamyl-tRNA reductase [Deltaproteobacteria bacterium]|nr:glutamyl-tRNA reductase [Deltaproteobacteria bacterium]
MDGGPYRVIGLSHRTAPVDIRERFSFNDEAAARLLSTLAERAGIREAVLLSTCNRTEMYYVEPMGCDTGKLKQTVLDEMAGSRGRQTADLTEYIYEKRGLDMVRHLFMVASSLDSLVLGEPQILGQVKNAYRVAMDAGTLGGHLGRTFERSFKVAKEVRNSTAVGMGEVSVGSVAVDLARKVFGDLSDSAVLMMGAGKMAETVAKTLSSNGCSSVVVANRTVEKARSVAGRYDWSGVALEDVPDLVARADIVIASLNYPGYVLDRSAMKSVIAVRRFKPLFMVDISLPRVIEPEVGRMEGAYLYNIDDFNQIIDRHLHRRAQDADSALEIIDREVDGVRKKIRELTVQPLIGRLRKKSMQLKDQELKRALREMGEVTDEQRRTMEMMASSIVDKMLHNPIMALRRSVQDERDDVAEAVKEMFGIEADEADKREAK